MLHPRAIPMAKGGFGHSHRTIPSVNCSHAGSAGSGRYAQHQGRGNVGQLVAPQLKRTANPSPINVAPTSTPLTRSVPQRRPKLQAFVPSVPGGQEQVTCWNSGRPLRTSSRRRCPAASPFLRSASQRARLPVSGALNPTKRTFGRPSPRPIGSPSTTYTETGARIALAGPPPSVHWRDSRRS